jgi:hypothetical protein
MKDRRTLVEGLKKPADAAEADKEKAFVYGEKAPAAEKVEATLPASIQAAANVLTRVQFSTRMRADFAELLKRASLERQLEKVQPNTLQDILEEAIEPWLRTHGYLK